MTLNSGTARVKEKIRYDINVHREQNKQFLLNSRRGVQVEEADTNDVFTVEDMRNLALEIKRKRQITVKHLKILKNALLNGQEFVLAFNQVPGSVDSLLHFMSSKLLTTAAIGCVCSDSHFGTAYFFLFQVKTKLCNWRPSNVSVTCPLATEKRASNWQN